MSARRAFWRRCVVAIQLPLHFLLVSYAARPVCAAPCPVEYEFAAEAFGEWLDFGADGLAHNLQLSSDTMVTLQVDSCANAQKPCGDCALTGPVRNRNSDAGNPLNQRCTNNSAIACDSDEDCPEQCVGGADDGESCTNGCPAQSSPATPAGVCAPAGNCAFYLGTSVPLPASTSLGSCLVTLVWDGVTGTVNPETGEFQAIWPLTQKIYAASDGYLCPACSESDTGTNVNDGSAAGTCTTGARKGLACDATAFFPFEVNGEFFASLDCPSTASQLLGSVDVTVPLETSDVTRAPARNCRDTSFPSPFKCFCDTCQTLAAEPCASNGDCPVGRTCGGRRCLSGTNRGEPCTTNGINVTECGTGGSCGVPGNPSRPNACLDGVCSVDSNGDGFCAEGPISQRCETEPWRVCTSNTNCAPSDVCGAGLRPCFEDNGSNTGLVTAVGSTSTPVEDTAAVRLAGLYCTGPGTTTLFNISGLPGLSRISIPGALTGYQPPPTVTPTATLTATPTRTATPTVTVTPTPFPTATSTAVPTPPVDPALVAPPLDRTVVTTISSATEFLYTDGEIQHGVAMGTIVPERAAVIRGSVTDRTTAALAGAIVSIAGRPEYGFTLTRADGWYDLAVNGGEPLTVRYEKAGYLPIDRTVEIPWQDWVVVPPAVLIPPGAPTPIDLDTSGVRVVQGAYEQDDDPGRRATLLFLAGIDAQIELHDGTLTPLQSRILQVSATEYTVGNNGKAAMPAELPPSSEYTYAVELRVEEVAELGARGVVFNMDIPVYVENFIDLPIGSSVPSGYYDSARRGWAASTNGRVVRIVGIDSAGRVTLDVDGEIGADGTGALEALGITDEERAVLATLVADEDYALGQSLWRMPVRHFSPYDFNLPAAFPPDAEAPNPADPEPEKPDDPCPTRGSIIGVQRQSLGEILPIAGTPYNLVYQSDRVPGTSTTLRIPLSGPALPASLVRISLEITIAGRRFTQDYERGPSTPLENLTHDFTWDRLDAYGRLTQGSQRATVRIGYVYGSSFVAPLAEIIANFGLPGVETPTAETREKRTLWRTYTYHLGTDDVSGQKLGGWGPDVLHAYDPNSRTLVLGSGARRSAQAVQSQSLKLLAGETFIAIGSYEDNVPALSAIIDGSDSIAIAPDGTLYYGEPGRIRRILKDGTVVTMAGTDVPGRNGDGAALSTQLANPAGLAFGSDGSLYFIDTFGDPWIRRLRDNAIETVAGLGGNGYCGDGADAIDACFGSLGDLAIAPDGTIFAADDPYIRRIGPNGTIHTYAGTGVNGFAFNGDGILATTANMSPRRLALARDGTLYFSDVPAARVRRISPQGIVDTVAGNGLAGVSGDGGIASQGPVEPADIALDERGFLYVAINNGLIGRVRRVSPDGTIATVAGTTSDFVEPTPTGGVPERAGLNLNGITLGKDQDMYLIQSGGQILQVAPTLPAFTATDTAIASDDGSEVYVFSGGRHALTLDALTGSEKLVFHYEDGLLRSIEDPLRNPLTDTLIERDSNGDLSGILAPGGQHTSYTMDGGFLDSVTNDELEETSLVMDASGLLRSLTTAMSNQFSFWYTALGDLSVDADPEGGSATLARTAIADGFRVTVTSELGRVQEYDVTQDAAGIRRRRTLLPEEGIREAIIQRSGDRVTSFADGHEVGVSTGADPRFGVSVPLLRERRITTPGGREFVQSFARSVDLADANNPLSLISMVDLIDQNGNVATRTYDAATRVLTYESAAGRSTTGTRDSSGRIVALEDDQLAPMTLAYESSGLLDEVRFGTAPNQRVFDLDYDGRRRLASIENPLTQTVSFDYDNADRVTSITLPDSRITSIDYDDEGRVSGITPPGGYLHAFRYTSVGQVDEYEPPVLPDTTTTYEYNTDRQLDLVTRPDGQNVDFAYDATTGRLMTIELQGGTQTFGYVLAGSGAGRLASIATNEPFSASVALAYDGSLPTSTTWTGILGSSVAVTRTYNDDLRVASMGVSGQSSVAIGYDDDGLVTSAGDAILERNGPAGKMTKLTVGNIAEVRTYDPDFGRLSTLTVTDTKGTSSDNDDDPLLELTYPVRDALGRIEQRTDSVEGATPTVFEYAYDESGRLENVKIDNVYVAGPPTYAYDDNGNRVSAPGLGGIPDYDDQDRLLTYGSADYEYTAVGDLASKTVGSDETTYAYDAFGNLRSVNLPNGDQIVYVIDAMNRRVGRRTGTVGSTTLERAWLYDDALRITAELDATGAVVARFVYGSGGNVPDYVKRGSTTYRIIADDLGSPRLVVNAATGSIAQELAYDEFGRATLVRGTWAIQPFGFAGGLYDPETGLVRFGLRDYDAHTGRWTTKDPILFLAGDTNLYGYVLSDPVNLTDPTGQFCVPCAVAGGALGLLAGGLGSIGPCGDYSAVLPGALSGALFGALGGGFGTLPLPGFIIGGVGGAVGAVATGSTNPGQIAGAALGGALGGTVGGLAKGAYGAFGPELAAISSLLGGAAGTAYGLAGGDLYNMAAGQPMLDCTCPNAR